jgi:DNA ligase D-like protein (predicted ligase)
MKPIEPMLAVPGKAFSRKGWIFEPKIDGARCMAYISNGTVELRNRRLRSIAYRYPEIIRALKQSDGECVLDGEMAVFSKGIPSFSSLAVREQQIQKTRIDFLSKDLPASYMVFDILYLGQESLMDRPLAERKSILKSQLQESDVVNIIDYVAENGKGYFKAALGKGLEGIMAKRLASPYRPGVRSRDWIKIKKNVTFDLVVGGYTPGRGQRQPYFGALLLGAYDSDSAKLNYIVRVGSGFSTDELKEISSEFVPSYETPFSSTPFIRDVRWLKPEIVVEVEALEVSKRGHLRAPVFRRIRDDKSPQECTVDQLQTT